MALIAEPFSSSVRPVLRGVRGAISAAHPLAVAAGQQMLVAGGSAADATIAAQAVLCVIMPDACGLGGDMFALVDPPEGDIVAINGAGAAPQRLVTAATDGANSVTVPGIVDGWVSLHARWGRLTLAQVLAPAQDLAEQGVPVSATLAGAVQAQRARLLRGGAAAWDLLDLAAGQRFAQPRLAALLGAIGREGASAFYQGAAAAAIETALAAGGGVLDRGDLARHRTPVLPAISVRFGAVEVAVQPPATQGVLLAMALQALERCDDPADALIDHLCVELTEAAFMHRARVAEGAVLLALDLPIDPERAGHRGGPRAYLHTAGVAAVDGDGLVVSSLVSVFDDFGSCVFVPELGITLNNRAGGFTDGANAAAPGKRPVHTLAPAIVRGPHGSLALATPGADGQVQTLLQVIDRVFRRGEDLASAIAAPRWRSEAGKLLIDRDHPWLGELASRGHQTVPLAGGDMRFGAVVAAGRIDGQPVAGADWRRETWAGVT